MSSASARSCPTRRSSRRMSRARACCSPGGRGCCGIGAARAITCMQCCGRNDPLNEGSDMKNRLKFVVGCVITCVTILALVTSFVAAQNAQNKGKGKGKGKQRQAQRREQPATQPSDRVYGIRVTEDEGYHTAPAAAEAGGAVHLVWIQ